MIKEFVDKWETGKGRLQKKFEQTHPSNYGDIVKSVIQIISRGKDYGYPDPNRIHEIDDGDYQGTLVFVVAGKGYQPNDYWYVKVYYGSCSGCDTLQAIREYSSNPPTNKQVKDYMSLALHIVQGLKSMNDD